MQRVARSTRTICHFWERLGLAEGAEDPMVYRRDALIFFSAYSRYVYQKTEYLIKISWCA